MDDETQKGLDAIVAYHADLLAQALKARERYAQTGELTPLSEAPHITTAWQAATAAVQYARRVTPNVRDLPKKWTWIGVDFLLIFTPYGTVEIATDNPMNSINLCHGLVGWIDPQNVQPKARA